MSTEELLFPRYKVIATWPGMHIEPFRLHQVVTLQPHKEAYAEGFIYIPYKHKPKSFMWESFFTMFPHLFKKLEWWEERKPEEMPDYVKLVIGNKNAFVHKVEGWVGNNAYSVPMYDFKNRVGYVSPRSVTDLQPATAAEYEDYINKKNNDE